MNKINDLQQGLNPNVNIKYIYDPKKIKVDKIDTKSTNDIIIINNDINLLGKKYPSINNSNNRNIDGLSCKENKRIKIINKVDLSEKIKKIVFFKKRIKNNFKLKGNFNILKYLNKLRSFSLILLIIFLFLYLDKLFIEKYIKLGYSNIILIKNNITDIEYVEKKVNDAKFDFIVSDFLYYPFRIIPNQNIKNGYYLIQGGKNISELLNKGIQIYKNTMIFVEQEGGIHNIKITNLLTNLQDDIDEITTLLYITINIYNKINNISDPYLSNKLVSTKSKLKDLYKTLDIINKDYDIFLNLLGHKVEKKYLVLFQNNDEIRATGGFIGSLALITIKNGKIINFNKDDIYAYEWEINKVYTKKDPAPKGLNQITDTFGLRDANYYIDFDKSSDSINFFLQKINKNIDGLIYINQNTFLDFLKLSGGIEFKDLGETITDKNFSLLISTLVEAQSFKVGSLGTPKKILFDFANDFINKIKSDKNYYEYFNILYKNIKSRDLVLYSFNSEENNLLWKLGFNGKIKYSDTLDFTYPVYTNIGGNKSDRYIDIKYTKTITKNNDCSINTKFKINRTHRFSKFEEQKVNNLLDRYPIKDKTRGDIINIQGKGVNKVYTRVLLPKNAIIKPKKGMIINKYFSANVLEFYIKTRPLESTNYTIEYTLINSICKEYDFKLYKQPGIRKYSIELSDGNKNIKNLILKNDFNYN